jgi:hypothetical protein
VGKLEKLLQNYERTVSLAWERGLAGEQRVWFAVYDENEERRLRARLTEFELATQKARHGWLECDVTNLFGQWMAAEEYRESIFADPEDNLKSSRKLFEAHAIDRVRSYLQRPEADEHTVAALFGIGGLFGFMHVSNLVKAVTPFIRGRLLVFFPGKYENNNYRLLDARDGWTYLAVPITALEGDFAR